MTRPDKDTRIHQDAITDPLKAKHPGLDRLPGKSVRGSGFTYDEEKERTDISVPENQSKDTGMKVPDLGRPNTA